MFRSRLFLGAVILAGLAVVAPLAYAQGIPTPVSSSATSGISVVGEGIVTVQPDVAHITLGVDVMDPLLANAQAEASRRMDAVVQKLKAAGIPDSDIRTVNYSINPQYDFRNGQTPVLRGYQIQNLVDVKITNIGGMGSLLDDVVSAGATRVMGIRFEAADMSSLKAQARDQAMQNARAKADQLARAAGVSLGRPMLIEESDTGGVTPVRAEMQAAPAAVAAAPTTPIQPGEMQVRTTVRVVWSIQ